MMQRSRRPVGTDRLGAERRRSTSSSVNVLGSVRGTLIASLVLGLVEAYGTIFIGGWLDRDAIAFLALIVLLMIRPQGFTGARMA